MHGNDVKNVTQMANSLLGYIALLRLLASFCKGRVGDRSIQNRALFNVMCYQSS